MESLKREYPYNGTNAERHAWGEWFERKQREAIALRFAVETDETIPEDEVHLYVDGELEGKIANLGNRNVVTHAAPKELTRKLIQQRSDQIRSGKE